MSQETLIAILSISIPAIVTAAGIVIAWQTEKLRTMREQLSEKKYNAYAEAVKMFYSKMKDSQLNKPANLNQMMVKMIEVKRDILMYGSDDVFRSFNNWLTKAKDGDEKQFAAFLDFVLEMRKDMCGGKTKLKKYDILLNLTQREDEAMMMFKK